MQDDHTSQAHEYVCSETYPYDHLLYSNTTSTCRKWWLRLKDHFFLAQTWSLNAGFTVLLCWVGGGSSAWVLVCTLT